MAIDLSNPISSEKAPPTPLTLKIKFKAPDAMSWRFTICDPDNLVPQNWDSPYSELVQLINDRNLQVIRAEDPSKICLSRRNSEGTYETLKYQGNTFQALRKCEVTYRVSRRENYDRAKGYCRVDIKHKSPDSTTSYFEHKDGAAHYWNSSGTNFINLMKQGNNYISKNSEGISTFLGWSPNQNYCAAGWEKRVETEKIYDSAPKDSSTNSTIQ